MTRAELEAARAAREQEAEQLKAEMRQLEAQYRRGLDLLNLKNGAIQQINLLLAQDGAGNSDESPDTGADGKIADPQTSGE